jgi:virginiamycin A acetyltransferase
MFKKLLAYILKRLNLKELILDQNVIDKKTIIGEEASVKGCTIRGTVNIGKKCKIMYSDIIGDVRIGNYTSLWGPNVFIRSALNPVSIGNFCSIARNVTIQEYNHDYKKFSTYFIEQNFLKNKSYKDEVVSKGPINIGHDVWIGVNCVILSGSNISTGAIIGAGSVVSGYIPPYAIAIGSPAKVIKYRFDDSIIEAMLKTEWWEWEDDKLKDRINILNNITENNK